MFWLFRRPALSAHETAELLEKVQKSLPTITGLETETRFNVATSEDLTQQEERILHWVLRETFEPHNFGSTSFLKDEDNVIIEVGPRLSFETAWSTNAVNICRAAQLKKVVRLERSTRYLLKTSGSDTLSEADKQHFASLVHDRMTQCVFEKPLTSFDVDIKPEDVYYVPVMEKGRDALVDISQQLGLAFDDQDLAYYSNLFINTMKRNPTNVEVFDLAQSNSEHSRHWFFGGKMIIDGEQMPHTLFELVKATYKANPNNSVIAFHDNSSSQRGGVHENLVPSTPGQPCSMIKQQKDYDITLTAETHNFPCAVAPFPGAETGTGGRLRDGHSTGTGSLVLAGIAAYCVGNLNIPGYELPWEDAKLRYPSNLAPPLQIAIDASNGASDYGNKFGEPVICGYARSFGMTLPSGERREWIKPIMFAAGIGQMDHGHSHKHKPEPGMLVIKLGGPAYRIGVGGGAASSMVSGDNREDLDFNAVQRGDAEMLQKTNRVIRACIEMGTDNPIVSIHDQGAGGSGNVLKEIVEECGGEFDIRNTLVGDPSMSVLELWVAEFQENDAILLKTESLDVFRSLCERENAPFSVLGTVTNSGRAVVMDSMAGAAVQTPVDLDLQHVLGQMPKKTFMSERVEQVLRPLVLPKMDVSEALDRVLRLMSVSSKRWLTTKVDRSVTGLIAQQQCVGPLHIPLADVAVIAQSHLGFTGAATAIGEQPIKSLLDCSAMARMSIAESLSNLVFGAVSSLPDVRCSGNWMWAAKMQGEGARMYDAALAIRDFMITLGMAVDGGKDSLSMAARVPQDDGTSETVKCPGSLVITSYCRVPDIRLTRTPDMKRAGHSSLLLVDPSKGSVRLGGSALAHVFKQLGNECPDVDASDFETAFNAVHSLIAQGLVESGHDRSDGGLLVTALEMAFAGNCGVQLDVQCKNDAFHALFAEETGLVLEVADDRKDQVTQALSAAGVCYQVIGRSVDGFGVEVSVNGTSVLSADMRDLRDAWEATSFELDALQANPACVKQERDGLRKRTTPPYALSFTPEDTPTTLVERPIAQKPRVAIVRQEGSNGDREMTGAFWSAGFDTWDVTMSDLLSGRVKLSSFRGAAFVGGFSYADVMDSAKGWAATIKFNPQVAEDFEAFRRRKDTFSLGVCNGCQLLALLGWVPGYELEDEHQPRFVHNDSGRYESRWACVRVEESAAIMFKGMEQSVLGVWLAHGEGKAYFPDQDTMDQVEAKNQVPMRYVNDQGETTEEYPFNPNGSPRGISGLCSDDGRHLAIMPHPERCFLSWQWPYMPESIDSDTVSSPWMRMFQNARAWCEAQ